MPLSNSQGTTIMPHYVTYYDLSGQARKLEADDYAEAERIARQKARKPEAEPVYILESETGSITRVRS